MASLDRRAREQSSRRRLIISTARKLAESEGWDAVTTRRLSTEIEYSQPVLYKHFTGMNQIADAVATDGFAELATAIRAAGSSGDQAGHGLTRAAEAYLEFARENPAVYDAMFTRATQLRFASQDTPPELSAAFEELRQVVRLIADGQDADTLTEAFWAALHGLVVLGRAGRLRPDLESERVRVLVDQFVTARHV